MPRRPPAPPPEPPPANRWAVGLIISIIALVILAPGVLTLLGRPPEAVYEASGYRRLVNDLIAKRAWLRVDTASTPMRIVPSPLAPADDDAFKAFMAKSYLGEDMAKADAAVWEVGADGVSVTGIRPDAHLILPPFSAVNAWKGALLFRADRQATSVLVERTGGGSALGLISQADYPALTAKRIVLGSPGARGSHSAPRYDFVHGGRVFASVLRIGDRNLLQVLNGRDVTVLIGRRVIRPTGNAPRLEALEANDTLAFRYGGRETRYELTFAQAAISELLAGRGRVRSPGLTSLARAVEAALDHRDAPRIHLTLDSQLQAVAQAALEAEAERLRAGGEAFPAGVTVMDTLTGEVLALGAYPRDRSQLGPLQSASFRPDPLVERNPNFQRLPVGSVAKGPLSLAILASNPSLANLVISAAEERPLSTDPRQREISFRELLGVDLGIDIEDHRGPPQIDFETFLSTSSNKYAAALMLLGFGEGGAAPDAPSEPYGLGGGVRTRPPALAMLRDAERGPYGLKPRLGPDTAPAWARDLRQLFDLRAESDQSGKARAYDIGIWGSLANGRSEGFTPVSPEFEDFGLGDISEIGPDYIMTILGGSRGRWTTIKMAEAFSRMVTRRPVRSQLVRGARPLTAADRPLEVDEVAWGRVMDGLQQVVTQGTASSTLGGLNLAPADETLEVRLFAKTGTPNIERAGALKRPNAALQRYLERGCSLEFRQRVGLYIPEAGTKANRRRMLAAIRDQGRRCHEGEPELVLQEVRRLNALPGAKEGRLGLRLRGAQVVGVPSDTTTLGSIGHSVAVVAGVYRQDAPDDRPLRALTIMVTLQKRTEANPTPALNVARQVLCDPAVRAWLIRGPSTGCAR